MWFKGALFLLLCVNISGCFGSASVPEDTVVKVATEDMECPKEKLKVKKVTDNNWSVTGCGKKTSYMCTGSNFMTDGSCFKN